MTKIATILPVLLLVAVQKMAACDCFPIPTFCETITYNNNSEILPYLTVQRVVVNEQLANGVKVSVLETYAGNNLVGSELTIADGNGGNCVLFASTFLEVGGEYIIASQGDGDTVTLSECGITFLPVANGMVSGAVAPGTTEVSLPEFANTANCGRLSSTKGGIPANRGAFVVRPTLVADEVEIMASSSHYLADYLRVKLFDSAGRQVFEGNYLGVGCFGFSSHAVLDMRHFRPGMYFLRMQVGQTMKTEKLVKIE